ncbi:auxin-responsive protein SAUR36-like [Hordeum vulgare subsp. vulgare]|uniref:auxin-responsive protein SAUR36-like n=1 Tax=Hordeum vulgare subsp. vulgare TaxID=112509 RepID=UPI0002960A9F|nr:auxin-responsive protein SAUR36-like [Hordeum vulgare subsp. vulgare]
MAMIHPRRLAQLVRKWQKVKNPSSDDEACCTTSPIVGKGHRAMYAADGRRFEVLLAYLDTTVFGELLRMSQEEFGFTCDGRITLPFDVVVMEYAMCLLRRNASEEVESAFLSSAVMPCQYPSSKAPPAALHQQLAVCSS